MEKTKLLTALVVILLIVNGVTLSFFGIGKLPNHAPNPKQAAEFISRELDFSPTQEEQYAQLIEEHQSDTRKAVEKSNIFREELYRVIGNKQTDRANAMLDSVAFYQKQIEAVRYAHFQEVRAICNPAQQERFDQIIFEAIKMMMPPKKK
ncbi:MAG: periplasmic heavy metal sensor [Cytophagales bacterium]|nr:MAG: periplasmic heavy metal sensor [Cytophagales bacterium]